MGMTGAQVRAARGLLNMSVTELVEHTGLGMNTIRRAEASNSQVAINVANATLLRTTLERLGVIFIDGDELGPGVRLKSSNPLPRQLRRRDSKRTA
jgi:hypothetical protein